MNTQQQQHFHPMNQPYISQRYSGQRHTYNNGPINNNHESYGHTTNIVHGNGNNSTGMLSYESQRLLQYSQVSSASDNYNKQMYSRSSTNIAGGEDRDRESRGINNGLSRQNERRQNERNTQGNTRAIHINNQSFPTSKLGSPLPSSQYQQQEQISTNILHQKIHYLQKQLQQLTRLLQEQSKHSYGSSGQEYEEVAIENAQLTIKVQEMEEYVQKLTEEKRRAEQELMQLAVEYEKEHSINNELREKLMETNAKLSKIQTQLSQDQQSSSINQQPHSGNSLPIAQQKNTYSATLQRQNSRLNEQIQNLLSKLHNLNLQINQQQSAKDDLMGKMNEQLEQIQKLRKELSDQQLEKLQLQSMNQYLKEEINYVNELSAKRQKELQEKYIKHEVQMAFNQTNPQKQDTREQRSNPQINTQLQATIQQLETHKQQLEAHNQQLSTKYSQLQSNYHELQSSNNQLQSHIHQLEVHITQLQTNQQPQSNNQSLKQHIRQLQTQIIQLTHDNQSLNYELTELKRKPITPPRQSKSEPFKELFGVEESLKHQIRLLQQELSQEKERHQLINNKYTEMMENRQTRIYELQSEIRKLQVQNKTLKIQIQDKRKERDEARQQCEKLQEKVQQIRSSKSIISLNNSSWHQRQTSDKLERIKHEQRIKYDQTIRNHNDIHRKLLQQKNLQLNIYQNNISQLQTQLTYTRTQLYQLTAQLDLKDKEIKEKQYLVRELQELQQSHQKLIAEVQLIKKTKNTLQEQYKLNQQNIKHDTQQQIIQLNSIIAQKNTQINQLQQQIQHQQQTIKQKGNQNKPNININNQPQNSFLPYQSNNCPLCPQVLKQFNVYKQLMELKFQTMNQMLDQLKISFIRAQFEIKDQINKDKSKYEYWIQKYDSHDKEYRTLMERLWEWEKINARNNMVKQGFATFGSFNNKQHYITENGLKIVNTQLHNTNSNTKNVSQKQAAPHLSEIQYDLYLIKLQNSTLRSQISTLQKQLSQRDQNPQVSRQLEQLKKYSENLTQQNDQLKNHLSQLMSQRKILSSKQVTFGNINGTEFNIGSNKQIIKKESLFERYSNMANINTQLQEKTRNQQKALASAELLINKLKKQNDNLIEAKNYLEQQLDRQTHKYRELVKDIQSQRQRTRRQNEVRPQSHGNSQFQLIDRHNIPFEYIKHHPEHKRLQADFVALKRSYLEMDLQFKKVKDFYEEQLQKMKIQNDFHKDRIAQLQSTANQNLKNNLSIVKAISSNQLDSITQNGTIFSFNTNHNLVSQNHNMHQTKFSSEMSKIKENAVSMSLSHDTIMFNDTKIKTLEQRVLYLEKQVQIKCQQCQSYVKKYQELIKEISYHPRTPRSASNQQNIKRIQKLASNIDVSPIQSPQWQTHSAQRQHSDRLFPQSNTNTTSFDQKIIDKLKQCIDKKMIQLQITPRESSNIIIKATWFIERLANDIKELRNNIEILKGQRKAIMKERNQLKNILENGQNMANQQHSAIDRGFRKPHQPQRYQDTHSYHQFHQANQSTGYEFNKPKINKNPQIHEKIPKLHFDSNDSPLKQDETNQNQLPDVIRETLQLKNHRRSGLKKFQKQLQILSEN